MSRILLAATPEIALPVLEALVGQGFSLEVLTNPDAPVGRSKEPQPSPIKCRALELGLTVHTPAKLDGEFRSRIQGRFDLLLSFAYGKIFGPLFLGLFPRGGLNIHPSLLPRWRGPSPLNAALLAGDSLTGLTVQTLALGMDEGDVVYQESWTLEGRETAGTLGEKAALRAGQVIGTVVADWLEGKITPVPQKGSPLYCSLLRKEDGQIDWNRPAAELDCQVRGLHPWPGAYTTLAGQKLNLWEVVPLDRPGSGVPGQILSLDKKEGILVQTGRGLLAIRQLQLASKKSLDHRSFCNGNPGLEGLILGGTP